MNIIKIDVVVPDWTKWVAQDKDGEWYAYEEKPKLDKDDWVAIFADSYRTTTNCLKIADGVPPKDFTTTLQECSFTNGGD